jgi:hypothetical protein
MKVQMYCRSIRSIDRVNHGQEMSIEMEMSTNQLRTAAAQACGQLTDVQFYEWLREFFPDFFLKEQA